MDERDAPVGMFDSGLGGLSVLLKLRALLPFEDVRYYADSAHCPYGDRTPDYILKRCCVITDYLLSRGAKVIVVACNTASSVALAELRRTYDVPIVGMVPAVKPAVAATRSGKIGVIATPRTVTGEALAALIREHSRGTKVYTVPGVGLVELVEAGLTSGAKVECALRPLLNPLLARGVDTIVLGCTHYPFLREAIQIVGGGCAVIDSGEAVARRTLEVLRERGLVRSGNSTGDLQFYTSGDADHVGRVASLLLSSQVTTAHLPL